MAATVTAKDRVSDTSLPGPNEFVNTSPKAEMIYYQEPVYPQLSKEAGHQGLVKIKALIDSKSVVRDAIIYRGSGFPLLDQAALDAAPLCKWKPGCTRAWPVASWATYDVEFKLEKKSAEASEKEPESFAVLVHRETGFNKKTQLPEGKLWMWAGFTDGLDSGMTGAIRRENNITGWTEVANVVIEWVNGKESRGNFLLKDRDFALRDGDRVYFTVEQPPSSAILDRGLSAYSRGQLEDALSYLDEMWCLSRTNDFVREATEQCRERIKTWSAEGVPADQLLVWRRYKNDLLCNAQIMIEFKKYHEAESMIQRVLLCDSTNSIAHKLRDSLPDIDFYTQKLSECDRFDSLLAGTAMPLVDEFIPLDSLTEFIEGDDPVYPKNDKHLYGWTVVDILVDRDGRVADAVINSPSSYRPFDDEALRCARSRRYRPAYIQGQPIASWVQLTVSF
jgi:TonB family protein